MSTPESVEPAEPVAPAPEPVDESPPPVEPEVPAVANGQPAAEPELTSEPEPAAEPEPVADPEAAPEPEAATEPESAPEPEAATESDPAGEADEDPVIVAALSRIEAQLGESQRLLDRQVEIATKLHAENQVLRAGELRKAQTAIVLSVLRVFDDVNQMAATATEEAARKDLSLVAESLADALALNGVEAVFIEPGVPFDGRSHKIATIEPTDDPDADRTVARVVRPGFAWADGDAVRVSDVAVCKYTPPSEPEPEPAAPAEPEPAPPADQPTEQ